MVKLISVKSNGKDGVVAELYADSKDEVTPTMTVENSQGRLSAGSMVYTADGDVGILKSTGEWSFI